MEALDVLVTSTLNELRDLAAGATQRIMGGLSEIEYRQHVGLVQGLDAACQVLINKAKELDNAQDL